MKEKKTSVDLDDVLMSARSLNNVFLIDFSWVMYKSYYGYDDLSVNIEGKEKFTGHIYGVLRTLQSIKEYDRKSMVILCEDGIPDERKDENEDYKGDRSHDLRFNIWEDKDEIYDIVYRLHDTYVAHNIKLEADDLLYSLAKKFEKNVKGINIYIHSSDNDLLQAVSDKIKIVKRVSKYGFEVIDKDNLYETKSMVTKFRNCPVEKLPFYRAIIGDSSDNLDGIYRFPRKFATRIAKKCECIEDMKEIEFDDLTKAKKRRLKQVQEDEWDKVLSNYKIMNLSEDIEFDIYRDDREKTKQRADELVSKFKLNSYQDYLIKSGLINEIGI